MMIQVCTGYCKFIHWTPKHAFIVSMMAVYVPERDQSLDILEMIEYPHFTNFHAQTLRLYCALSAQGNQKVAHILCKHVDELQLMYAISNHCKFSFDKDLL